MRIYSIIIYYLFKAAAVKGSIELCICKDFDGREADIKSNLEYFLGEKLGLKISDISFCRLHPESNAHKYAYLMRKDTKNKFPTYAKIKLEEIEAFLKK